MNTNPYQSPSSPSAFDGSELRGSRSQLTSYVAWVCTVVSIGSIVIAAGFLSQPIPIDEASIWQCVSIATASWVAGTCFALISIAFQRSATSGYALVGCWIATLGIVMGWGIAWQI